MAPLLSDLLNTELIDDVARAGYATWQYNRHDIPGALLHVHQRHVDPQVRAAAGEAYDAVLVMPIVWRAFEIDFEQRARSES